MLCLILFTINKPTKVLVPNTCFGKNLFRYTSKDDIFVNAIKLPMK